MVRISSVLLICVVYLQSSEQIYSGESHAAVFKSKLRSKNKIYNESIPEECEKLGICEEAEQYPEELAMKLMKEFIKSNIALDSDVNVAMDSNNEPRLSFRFNELQTNPCKYVTKMIVPLQVRHTDGKWYNVLNDKTKPIQVYKVQVCYGKSSTTNRNNKCNSIILHNDYESQCVQKNITRTILVMDVAKKNLFSIPVHIPCCCTCVAVENNK